MFYFIAAWLAGVAIHFLVTWAIEKVFSFKQQLASVVVSSVLGIGVAWLFHATNFSGWLSYIILAALGFLSNYLINWLYKKTQSLKN